MHTYFCWDWFSWFVFRLYLASMRLSHSQKLWNLSQIAIIGNALTISLVRPGFRTHRKNLIKAHSKLCYIRYCPYWSHFETAKLSRNCRKGSRKSARYVWRWWCTWTYYGYGKIYVQHANRFTNDQRKIRFEENLISFHLFEMWARWPYWLRCIA